MEISSTSKGVFYMAKILGLAPFAVHKNEKSAPVIKRSLIFTVYSTALISLLVFLTYRGLVFDANSKMPIRMKSATSKVVTALDVSLVVLSAATGACCGMFGLKSTRELNKRLQQFDNCVHSYSNYKADRIRGVLMLLPLLGIVLLLGYDITTWLRYALRMKVGQTETELNVQWYIPFYAMYFILTGVHVTFANTAFGLGRRFRRLNAMLRGSLLQDSPPTQPRPQEKSKNKTQIHSVQTVFTFSAAGDSLIRLKAEAQHMDAVKNKGQLIRLLAENHASLNTCMSITSAAYGVAVLLILVSCLLHLVATSYFLFLEFLDNHDNGYVCLQILWILFHIFRLLLVVEPCHVAGVEARKTVQIVCEIERKISDPILLEEIKMFWQQLLVLNGSFSACGLCDVNRNLLTSIGSAIATYLVILIQFQKTNG